MFELWIATFTLIVPCRSDAMCLEIKKYETFSSSATAVSYLMKEKVNEFWLYPVRDFTKEEWHVTVDLSPKVKVEKKP